MSNDLKDYINQWMDKAEKDIFMAESLLDKDLNKVGEGIGFHLQQSIEKYLKAYLSFKNYDFPYWHNLTELCKLCSSFDEDFSILEFENLNSYAVEFRYPSNYKIPDKEEIRKFLAITLQTKQLVRSKIIFD